MTDGNAHERRHINVTPQDRLAVMTKLHLYTITTPTHESLLERWLAPSSAEWLHLHVSRCEQECTSGAFKTPGWTKTIRRKVTTILDAIEERRDDVIVYSDADAQFFNDPASATAAALDNVDIAFQRDNPNGVACAGFFLCRCNERTRGLWQTVLTEMDSTPGVSDQPILNRLLRRGTDVRWELLPATFLGAGTFNGHTGYRWRPGHPILIPENIIYHHANWTEGVAHKEAQLSYVKEQVLNRRIA